ncbi:alpha/beta fold hydrolase [Aequorivita capsosiphonis]|uniref:alpha/beta fold hydrolase n=1 Tax=Aequorivita capsosiphonis TaxID=487317 RepID=UPI00040EAD4F|nr:alpha/beta hydrolase [Aequorivita capsosiphonis]
MEEFQIVSFLLLFLFSPSGDLDKIQHEDEYAEFKIKPSYITTPTSEREDYFEAYDKTLQLWGVEYEDLYINTSKGIAHVITCGPRDGVPVVLMHGMSASSTMWYPNAKALSSEYRLFAIDLIIEPGKSYKTVDLKNIDEITAWYEEVLDKLKLESFHLIGTSRGGWLATDLALHSEKVKSVILLSPVQTISWMRPSGGLLKNMLNIFYPKEKRALRTLETLSNDPSKIEEDYIEQSRLALKNDTLKKFMLQMRPFSNKVLESLKMPVLVLVGDRDLFNGKRSVKLTEKYIPEGEGAIISNSGHFLSIDQTDEVNQKMLDFLHHVDQEPILPERETDLRKISVLRPE